MPSHVDKEATLAEVMDEVSLRDLGSQLRAVFIGLGCLGTWLLVAAAGNAGIAASGYGFRVPTVVAIAFITFIFVMAATRESSIHKIDVTIFFPRLGLLGWLCLTAYITGTIEAFRIANRITDDFTNQLATFGTYFVLVTPPWLFIGLMQLGYQRLNEKRAANVSDHPDARG